jgi:BirA family biotin operon repressor/biotin-[acetyl-CoA-carboxylase] ligase
VLSASPVGAEPLPPDFAEAIGRVRVRLGSLGDPILFFSSIGSTNDVAGDLAARGNRHAVVIADAQTSGRGRRGRRWFSPPGAGLYVSAILGSPRARRDSDRTMALVTIAAGVAIAEGVERASGLRPDIKWPNDLLVGGRKVGGILAEAVASGPDALEQMAVLGYGINVGQVVYPVELADAATCLGTELGRAVDRASLFAETLASLAERHRDLIAGRFDAILDAWRERAKGHHGALVSWETPTGPQTGVTAGIDEMGALLVRVGDHVERLIAGEVHWHN